MIEVDISIDLAIRIRGYSLLSYKACFKRFLGRYISLAQIAFDFAQEDFGLDPLKTFFPWQDIRHSFRPVYALDQFS